MNPITLFLVLICLALGAASVQFNMFVGGGLFVLAVVIALSLKMANTWQRFVVLRAGHLHGVKGPGLFLIFPIIDNVVAVIDERIQTTSIVAEQALTKDTVPVNVDAIIFWKVHNAEAAALTITNYREAIDRISQTVHAYPTLSEGPARAADAHLRARFARPGAQRVARGALRILGHLDHAR